MAAPFNPPTNFDSKPEVPKWVPPPPPTEDLEYAKLHSIDLSLLDSPDPEVVKQLVETAKIAIGDDGFLYLVNYGINLEQLHRQFSIARYLHRNISEEDKEKLHWDPQGGLYAGYKPPFGWRTIKGKYDGISQFNFYEEEYKSLDKVPECIHPFMDEISAFTEYLTRSVNKRLLTLLSKVLEMPDDFLYENIESKGPTPINEGYLRHALFHPFKNEEKGMGEGLRMFGHTDFGTTTMLFSVPVTCLQLWGRDGIWRYVKYAPGALVINIGDTLELISGGHFRATRHRVHNPPPSQETFERLSVVLFNGSKGDLRMQPCWDSPLIKREGCFESQGAYKEFKVLQDKGIPIPTNKEWREISIINTRHPTDEPEKLLKEVTVDGVKYIEVINQGVRVLQPL
ncbi:hypothetical protein L486_04931 [Kwoniella mangroviensis CBS 10435]|uniref:Fe2OG dioxygenase domain-containing protein n=1 Tax=Kwoniella mangroviensis CBS 10435 TaxID=1331196 RepID=A0A1B9IPI0_9TREE|nr:hypothetical protein L486_04931 [Kwoniella mangroviensis CBS 10435]